jgi:biotin carboxyl carrier protein
MIDKFEDIDSSKHLRFFLMVFLMFLVIIIFILQLRWTPKYPVDAEIELFPSLIEVVSPTTGMIVDCPKLSGDLIYLGEKLFEVEHLTYRMNQSFFQKKKDNLEIQKSKLADEVRYLLKRYQRLKPLVQQKILTQDYIHQQWSELNNYQLKLSQVNHELVILDHKKISSIQSPTSGRILQSYIHVGDKVEKGQQLFIIQLPQTHWQARVDVPVEYRKFLKPTTFFRFKSPSLSKFTRYQIVAKLNYLLPIAQSNRVQVIADIQKNHQKNYHFLSNMKLQGYLMGEQQSIFKWLMGG